MSRGEMSVAQIAEALGFMAAGATDLKIARPAHPKFAKQNDLALAMDGKFVGAVKESAAQVAMLPPGEDWRALGLQAAIFAPRARFAMAGVTQLYAHPIDAPAGVHPSAVIAKDAQIGENVSIGPLCVIGPRARIGANSRVLAQAAVAEDAQIGEDALIHSGARICARVTIGARAIIHPNAVVGSDGFSFVTPEVGSVESAKSSGVVAVGAENRIWARIHSLGSVFLGDDVEIGACAVVDRGTVADTVIGSGTKIDNHVQIGHNCQVGENCLFCGHAALAGSCEIGDRVVFGGKSGAADHSRVGSDVLIMASAGVSGVVKPRSIMGGIPAVERNTLLDSYGHMRRLPRYVKNIDKLIRDVATLKKRFPQDDTSG